jgi:hypothetical protein
MQVNVGPLESGGQIMIRINNTGSAVDQSVNFNGSDTNLFFSEAESNIFAVSVSNASIRVGDLLTLEGSLSFSDVNGYQSAAGTGIRIFMGEGPARFADGTINPQARGMLIEDATVGIIKFDRGTVDEYAIDARGSVKMIGIEGVSVSGELRFRVNSSNESVNQSISFGPDGDSINVVFDDDQVSTSGDPYSSITGNGMSFDVLGSKFSADVDIAQQLQDVNDTPFDTDDDEKQFLISVSDLDFSINDGQNVILAADSGQGKMLVSSSGLIGSARATVQANVPGLSLSGDFDVQFNTTGQSIGLDMDGHGNGTVSAGNFVRVIAVGANLEIAGQRIEGDLFFSQESQEDGSDLFRPRRIKSEPSS